MLAGSAQLSSMSQVNLLFAAQAAANNKDIDGAGELLQCLKDSYPASEPAAIKAEVELLVNNQQLAQALRKLQPLHRDRPTDTGVSATADEYFTVCSATGIQRRSYFGILSIMGHRPSRAQPLWK